MIRHRIEKTFFRPLLVRSLVSDLVTKTSCLFFRIFIEKILNSYGKIFNEVIHESLKSNKYVSKLDQEEVSISL
jgi:hypothetical protein